MGLVDFHKRKLKALVAHIVMRLLSHTMVSLIKLFDKITDCIKENLFKAFTGVKAGGRGLAVILDRGLKFASSLSYTIGSSKDSLKKY